MPTDRIKPGYDERLAKGVPARRKRVSTAATLAALLSLGACQSAMTGLGPNGAWDEGGIVFASAHRGSSSSRLRPLDLTLEPGVPFNGCLVIESVKLGGAEAGSNLIC